MCLRRLKIQKEWKIKRIMDNLYQEFILSQIKLMGSRIIRNPAIFGVQAYTFDNLLITGFLSVSKTVIIHNSHHRRQSICT
jgi:hypothetical protein